MEPVVPGLLPNIDPDGLQEFSVVFTDRSLNHMSKKYQAAMRDISTVLKDVYNASAVALVPGGGTYASVSRIDSVTAKMKLHDLNKTNVARAVFGTASEVEGDTVVEGL